ncbi:MAG: hypothetical protein JRJ08_01920 [Deltaproteobacteria bacterium]|nr:hypothetical protein [Deltaproteobacteria bacterium]
MRYIFIAMGMFLIFSTCAPVFAEDGFTQKDRELLIELKVKMGEIDNRFEQVNKRLEQVDRRFGELRSDMNKRFEQMMDFFKIMTGLFGALIIALIGFVLWDRHTLLKEARRASIEYIEKESTIIRILKDYAARDEKMWEVLKGFRIL